MTALTLPGDIPGLLRRCSPVVASVATASGDVFFSAGARSVVSDVDPDDGALLIDGGWFSLGHWVLDLTDPTGRAHAGWWIRDAEDRGENWIESCWRASIGTRGEIIQAVDRYQQHPNPSPEQIRRLIAIVLHVAGRAVTP